MILMFFLWSYSENQTSLDPTFVFGMDRCLVYTG